MLPGLTCCPPRQPPKGMGTSGGPSRGRSSAGAALLSSLRSDMVSVLDSYYYDDGCEPCGNDTFSREPFIVKFSSPTTREQSWRWGMPRLAQGPLHAGLSPGLCLPSTRGLQPPTRVPPMDAQGSNVPAQHGQQCLLFPTTCLPSPVISPHVFSPAVGCLTCSAASHCVLPPIIFHLPSCAISHHLLPLAGHHLPSPAIPHPFHPPSCRISSFIPLPTPWHHLHLLRASSGHTHDPISCPKPYGLGNADGKQEANPKPHTQECSSPLEFPV